MSKRILIIAGPNGAGKTTFARAFLPYEAGVLTFINADLIAAGISPFAPEAASVKAGKIMLEMIAQSAERGENFAIETTLSGKNYARDIPLSVTLMAGKRLFGEIVFSTLAFAGNGY